MLLLPILIPLLGGLALLFLPLKWVKGGSYALVTATTLLGVGVMFTQTEGFVFGTFPFGVVFSLQLDQIGIYFSGIILFVWLVVLWYSHSYFPHPNQDTRLFFGFYVAVLGAMLGVCYADNLVTLYLFFEFLSLLCVPLIAYERTEQAIRASKKFLYYSVAGAFMGLTGIFYFFSLEIPQVFQGGGIPELMERGEPSYVLAFTLLAVVGFGCKAGLFPLHSWLKTAHPIAPAPASAILSGITTKAGVIAILRLLYYVVGVEHLMGTYVQTWGLALSILTILMGSSLAWRETVLKTRLAYSTVSQVSYVIFALFLFQGYALVGALLQVLFHALAKTALFLSAGTIIHETGYHDIGELDGLGRHLRPPFVAITVAGLSLVGVPFTGGFVSKWYLALGGIAIGGMGMLGVVVIVLSALLTAGYLLPIATRGFLSPGGNIKSHPLPRGMTCPILWILLLIFGILPSPLIEWLVQIGGELALEFGGVR